ncbi:hypothetical protein [Candidatus Methanomassiliicoccus intestinalis]|uniref:hypothetical protein n=1 Tax=Candidatus Methanomassiliicoccus intestinalis TaxID=1406512 RepID=UPI0037DD9408
MDPISLRCNNCGGSLEFEKSMDFGFCKYCGNKVMIPKQASTQVINVISDSTKFYLLIYYKGEQVQHAIKDEVTIAVKYRNNAAAGEPLPMGIEITTNGLSIPNKAKLSKNVGIGIIQISGIGATLTMSKEQKVKMAINGTPIQTNLTGLNYGDLVSLDNLIFRIQPMRSGL